MWRVGSKVPLNVYDGDRPVCQCHTPEDAARIVAAMNGFSAEAIIAIIQQWDDAYPETYPVLDGKPIFEPLPPASTESKEMQSYRTRASAAMGRHMSRALIRQIREAQAGAGHE